MRVFITITGAGIVETNEILEVSVGDGNQTFKWLAMTIEARLKQYKLLRKTFSQDSVVVIGLKNELGELIDPRDKLQEHCLSDSLNLTAAVLEQIPTDEYGDPMMNDWMAAAYINSEAGNRWHAETIAWREKLGKLRQDTRQTDLPSHRLLHIGEFNTEEAATAFDLDWGQLNWMNLGLVKGDPHRKAIHDFLKLNYVMICNFFQHFVGSGRVGEHYGLSLNEFGHCLHYCRLINFRLHMEKVEQIFCECTQGSLMSRINFVEGILKFCIDTCNDRSPIDLMTEMVIKSERTSGIRSMTEVWSELSTTYMAYSSTDKAMENTILHYYHTLKVCVLVGFYLTSTFIQIFLPVVLSPFHHFLLYHTHSFFFLSLLCIYAHTCIKYI